MRLSCDVETNVAVSQHNLLHMKLTYLPSWTDWLLYVDTIREPFLRICPSLLTNFNKLVTSGSESMRYLVPVADRLLVVGCV